MNRRTKIDTAWSLKEFIEHGMKDNNRTRKICVEKGWLSTSGGLLDTASKFIRDEFQPKEEPQ